MPNCGCKDSCSCVIRAGSDNVTIVGAGTNGSPLYIYVDGDGGTGGGPVSWSDVTDKPSSFTPSAHQHPAGDINSGVLAVGRLGSGSPAAGMYVDGGTGAWTVLPEGGGGGAGPTVKFTATRTATSTSLTASTWVTYPLNNVVENVGGGSYNTGTYIYTVPEDGLYLCLGQIRIQDNSASRSVAMAIGVTNADGAHVLWENMGYNVANGRAGRQYTRAVQLTAGDLVRLYIYSDGTTFPTQYDGGTSTAAGQSMTIIKMEGGGTGTGSGLPEGIGNPADYTAIDGAVINAGTSTTGFFSTPTLTTLNSLTTVSTQMGTTEGQIGGLNLSPAQSTAGQKFVVMDFAWDGIDGYTGSSDIQHLRVADATNLSGNYVAVEVPSLPENVWTTMVIPVGSLTEVESIGAINDRPGQYAAGGQKTKNYWRNIRWANQTEADQALQEGAVFLTATYVPGVTAEITEPVDGKTRVDLRADSVWIDRFGGVRHIREWAVPDDGLTEVSMLMAKALGSLAPGERLVLSPGAFYWVDYPIEVPSGVTLDFNGATMFTRTFRGGDNNVDSSFLRLWGEDIKVIKPRIFGYRMLTTNGSSLATVSGTPTNSSTNKLLDSSGESVQVHTVNAKTPWWGRLPLVALPSADRTLVTTTYPTFALGNVWVFTLSDSAQVASDCVIEAVNETTGVADASRTLTLTGTPTAYVLALEPADLEAQYSVRVRKVTATANTITVASVRSFGLTQYSSSNDNANAISCSGGRNLYIEDFYIEGAATDAIDWTGAANYGVVIRGGFSRACNRQGVSFNRGSNADMSDVVIIGPHRSGVDIEPYDQQWLATDITLRNIRIVGAENYGLALNNWAGIANLNMESIVTERCRAGGVLGGSRGGTWNNIFSDGDIYIKGTGVRASNLTCTYLTIGAEKRLFDDGTSYLTDVPGTGGPANSFTVSSATGLVVGQRINLSVGGAVTATDRRITAIAGNVVTFDGDPVTWGSIIEVYDGKALIESRDNVADGVTVSGPVATQVRGKNWVTGVRATGQSPHSSTLANVVQGSSGGIYSQNDDALTDQFGFSFRAPRSTHPPFTYGGLDLRGQPLLGVEGLSGAPALGTIQSVSGQGVGRVTSSSFDLGLRGLSPVVLLDASNVIGTNARLSVTVETSPNNTDWYTVDTFRDALSNSTVETMHVRFAERYLRTSYVFTADGGSPSVTFGTSVMYGVPQRNLSGTWTGASSSSPVLAFPSRTGPGISSFSLSANAATSTLGAGTYYYRIGARTRLAGPTVWMTEQSITITANQSVNLTISKWHGRHGYWTDGLSVLRGTSAGTYTQRYDVLAKAGVETFSYRHDIQTFTDLGTSVTPGGIAVEFPTTYPTASPKLTATDESAYELDTNYRVFTMPAYTSIVKRTDGFTPTFGAALTSFEWFVVR
jgi:hypothetical protein